MATIKKVEIIGGLQPEIYEYVWKLHNFELVQESPNRLAQQKFEIKLGQSSKANSKWLVGLKSADGKIQLYVKMLEITGQDFNFPTKVSILYGKSENSLTLLRTIIKIENIIAQNDEILVAGWATGQSAAYWRDATDENGTFVVKLNFELLVLHKEQSHDRGICIQEMEKASVINIHANFSKLLDNSDSHDVRIICSDGVEIGAHKLILSAQNSVFASLLQAHSSKNRPGAIEVQGISGNTMKILVYYLYTGELLPTWRQSTIISELMYAAVKYQLVEISKIIQDNFVDCNDYLGSSNFSMPKCTNELLLEKAEEKSLKITVGSSNLIKRINDNILAVSRGVSK